MPQETDPDLPMSVQESLAEVWVGSGQLQVGGTKCSSASMGPFEGGPIILITSTIFDFRSNSREGTCPTLEQKIGLKIY